MCLVVDANRVSFVFAPQASGDAKPIFDWLSRDGILIYGGKLALELARYGRAMGMLTELVRQGRARKIPDDLLEETVRTLGPCRSNDAHVVALVRRSGARTVCSDDQLLWADLRDRKLVPSPKVSIYRTARHAHLLRHTPGCPGYRR